MRDGCDDIWSVVVYALIRFDTMFLHVFIVFANPFQNVQDRRTEDGVAPMMFDNENFGRGGRGKGLKATNGDINHFQNSKFKKSGKPKPKQKRRGGF